MLRVIDVVLNAVFFLPAGVWLGGLVLLALATYQIEHLLQGRRTEAWQIVRKVRAMFQRVELVALAAMWIASIVQLVLQTILKDKYPGTWGTADGMKVGLMLIPTLTALYSTFYLTGAIRRQEDKLGAYEDRDGQTGVRKRLSLLHIQARAIVWLNAAIGALVMLSAVAGMG